MQTQNHLDNHFDNTLDSKSKIPNHKISNSLPNNRISTDRLKSLMNVQKAIANSRIVVFSTLFFSFLFCVVVVIISMRSISKSKDNIFITNGYGNTLTAYRIATNENRSAEAKAQVKDFHALLYDITPNPTEVERNINQVLLIGDGSIKAFLDKRGDKYYKKLIAQNVEIKYRSDSVKVNLNSYPYKAVQYGKEIVQSNVGLMVKNLLTTCELLEVSRTDDNPHGLLVSNFQILKNERLEFQELKSK